VQPANWPLFGHSALCHYRKGAFAFSSSNQLRAGYLIDTATSGRAGVTATNTDTGLGRTVYTTGEGTYNLPNLPIGPYTLTVSLEGFTTYVQGGIVLQVNSNPTVISPGGEGG